MKLTTLRTSPVPIAVALLLIGGVFLIDLYAPTDVATCVLYVAPMAIIAMWSPPTHSSLVVLLAIICTALTVFALMWVSVGSMLSPAWGNHALALVAIWATALLSLLRKRMEQKTRWIDVLPRV